MVNVDSYHYLENNGTYFDEHLGKLLQLNGLVALAFPSIKHEGIPDVPKDMKPFWEEEALTMWHSVGCFLHSLQRQR